MRAASRALESQAMVLTVAIVLALFVPWPWNLFVVAVGVVAEIGEVVWGLRLARRWRPKTGAEAMVGMRATAVSSLDPLGQVRVNGELWEARASTTAEAGDTVVVRGMDGLTLLVDLPSARASSHPDDVAAERVDLAGAENRRREANGHD